MRAKAKLLELPGGAEVQEEATTAAEPAELPPLRPGQCRSYMRRTLAREFRGIVDGFVQGAKSGSCQHVKLATELLDANTRGGKRAPKRPTGRGILRRLAREMEQECK